MIFVSTEVHHEAAVRCQDRMVSPSSLEDSLGLIDSHASGLSQSISHAILGYRSDTASVPTEFRTVVRSVSVFQQMGATWSAADRALRWRWPPQCYSAALRRN